MPQGFRTFSVRFGDNEFFLTGPSYGATAVEFPHVEATCQRTGHRAPVRDCGCGYNAYTEPAGAASYSAHGIMTEVFGYGRTDLYEFGFRSRQIKVQNFYTPRCNGSWSNGRQYGSCHEIATVAVQVYDAGGVGSKRPEWQNDLRFLCAFHAGETDRDGIDETAIFPIERVLTALSEKFNAGIYDAEVTHELHRRWPGLSVAIDRASTEAGHRANAAAQARREERKNRERAARVGRAAQMGLI